MDKLQDKNKAGIVAAVKDFYGHRKPSRRCKARKTGSENREAGKVLRENGLWKS